MRGLTALNKQEDSLKQKAAKRRSYGMMIKQSVQEDNQKEWLKRPAYCIGERRKQWEQTKR